MQNTCEKHIAKQPKAIDIGLCKLYLLENPFSTENLHGGCLTTIIMALQFGKVP